MAGPYHEGWARLGITAENEGREKGAENEGKGTGTGKGKVEKGAENDGKGTGTGKGKCKGKYTWEQFLEDEDVLFTAFERHVLRGDGGGALARVIAHAIPSTRAKPKAKPRARARSRYRSRGPTTTTTRGASPILQGKGKRDWKSLLLPSRSHMICTSHHEGLDRGGRR